MATSMFELRQKAVDWLKLNRDKIIEEQTRILFDRLHDNGKTIPAHRRRHIITILIHSFISRLEGKTTQTDTTEEIVQQMISVGVTLPRMVIVIDSLRYVVNWLASQDMNINAELNRFLTDKVDYFSQLAKANAAAGMVQSQCQNFLVRLPLPQPMQTIDTMLPNRVFL